ncbi:MAG: response regulator [Planctomycetota bacterium]|nr:response regulator [Planctomycetota bacterium]
MLEADQTHGPRMDLKPTILIVDDEPDNRDILRTMLEDDGYPVLLARDGREAVRKAGLNVGVVIMDVDMPNLDGVSACRLMRENPKTRDVPVLFLSATRDDEVAMAALEAGAYDFLPKPTPLFELRVKVAAVLSLNPPPAETEKRWRYLEALKAQTDNFRQQEEKEKDAWRRTVYEDGKDE